VTAAERSLVWLLPLWLGSACVVVEHVVTLGDDGPSASDADTGDGPSEGEGDEASQTMGDDPSAGESTGSTASTSGEECQSDRCPATSDGSTSDGSTSDGSTSDGTTSEGPSSEGGGPGGDSPGSGDGPVETRGDSAGGTEGSA
jgi:hypothetical protein